VAIRLQNKVIDIEAANRTPSPTIDPSVRTILVGHSMGGIVAAETLLSIVRDKPVSRPSSPKNPTESEGLGSGKARADPENEYASFMFPYIQGILAFDTPYLGISPGVVAHGAESHWSTATAAYNAYTNAASSFGWGAAKTGAAKQAVDTSKMLPAAGSAATNASAGSPWGKWGKFALMAAGAAVAGGGAAAAYKNRQTLTESWSWVGSHLEFVGCLARPEELRTRVEAVTKLSEDLDIGFANLYTCLGNAVQGKSEWSTGVLGADRTFCNVPKDKGRKRESDTQRWWEARNDGSTDEITAHMHMFTVMTNPGYYAMSEKAKDLVVEWIDTWADDAIEGSDVKFEGSEMLEEQNQQQQQQQQQDQQDQQEQEQEQQQKQKQKQPQKQPEPSDNPWAS